MDISPPAAKASSGVEHDRAPPGIQGQSKQFLLFIASSAADTRPFRGHSSHTDRFHSKHTGSPNAVDSLVRLNRY